MKRLRSFTLVELLLVVAVLAVVLALMVPCLGKARAYARSVACRSNLDQLRKCTLAAFAANFRLPRFAHVESMPNCPFDKGRTGYGYIPPSMPADYSLQPDNYAVPLWACPDPHVSTIFWSGEVVRGMPVESMGAVIVWAGV